MRQGYVQHCVERGYIVMENALGVSDALVGEKSDVAIDRLNAYEPHESLVRGLTEEALAGPEHDRVDLQAQLVDEKERLRSRRGDKIARPKATLAVARR